MSRVFKLIVLFYCGYSSAATLSYKELSADTFQLTLHNDVSLEIGQAQSALYPTAAQVCGDRSPSLGKYSFESAAPVSESAEASSFTFVQEVRCTNEVAVSAPPNKQSLTGLQEEAIKSAARKLTETFLSAKESGDYKKAYEMLGSEMKSTTKYSNWNSRDAGNYGDNTGELGNRDIWRMTLYNNPPNSPKPGLYIAADYENTYKNSSIHCGYVMWYLPTADSSELSVMREEYGVIGADVLKAIDKEDLQAVRKKFRCNAP